MREKYIKFIETYTIYPPPINVCGNITFFVIKYPIDLYISSFDKFSYKKKTTISSDPNSPKI